VLPGIVNEAASDSAAGRLEQPLTYWNASGVLAAVGLILAMRIAADVSRPAPLRSASVAAVVPLGLTAYLTFSRGALLAIAVGVIMLIVLSRERRQMRVFVVGICGAVLVSLAAAFLPAARTLQGTLNEREQQGLLLLIILVAVSVAVVLVSHWWCAREDSGPLSAPRALAGALIVVVVIGFSAAAAGNGSSNGQPRYGADTRRLASFESNRYSYWKVAGGMFVAAPLAGDGSGSFRVVWRQERTILDPALDAHSLYLETGAELGILGLIALALFIGGVAWAGRNVALARRNEVTGALAALAALAVHAGLDWDWEMPAIALVGLLLAGVVVAANDEIDEAASADA
jgi:O-antigen ligase